jgi:hypothetical protein
LLELLDDPDSDPDDDSEMGFRNGPHGKHSRAAYSGCTFNGGSSFKELPHVLVKSGVVKHETTQI